DATCPPTITDPKPAQDQSEDHFQTTSVDQGLATAAPKPLDPGKRCDELYGLPSSTSPTVDLPEFDASRAKSQWDEYEYVNPAKEWDGLGPPSAAKEAALSQLTKAPATQPDRVWWR
ncbi:hypothetical protein ACFYTG_54230, partial [Streptomyces mirabilis]